MLFIDGNQNCVGCGGKMETSLGIDAISSSNASSLMPLSKG